MQWEDRCKGDLQTTQCSGLKPGMVGSDNAERQTKESELHPVDKGGTERELKSDVWFEKV